MKAKKERVTYLHLKCKCGGKLYLNHDLKRVITTGTCKACRGFWNKQLNLFENFDLQGDKK